MGFPGGSVLKKKKNLSAMQEMQVLFLGQEDPLGKEMTTTQPSILAWKIPWTEEPDGLQSMALQELDVTEQPYSQKTSQSNHTRTTAVSNQ